VSPALEKQADAQDDGDEEGASRDGSVESLGSRVGKSGNSPFEPPASVSPLKWEETTSPAPPISLNDGKCDFCGCTSSRRPLEIVHSFEFNPSKTFLSLNEVTQFVFPLNQKD
jgi:hypothetical protein